VTFFDDPLQRIRLGQIAQVPILLGSMEDDGSIFVLNAPNNLSTFLAEQLGSGPLESLITPALVRALYPGLSDSQVIAAVVRDITFRWCAVPLLI
jgi:carboxylesterase type B